MPYYDPSAVYPAWNEETAYAKGDVVSYGGYLYLAMDATEAGDNPRTAVKDFEFTKSVNNGFFGTSVADPVDVSMRLWTIFDFPVSVYYARLRGIKDTALQRIGGQGSAIPSEEGYHTISVQNGWFYSSDNGGSLTDTEYPRMQPPSAASWDGYGMPGGMTSHYNITKDEASLDWIYGLSSVLKSEDDYGSPKSYGHAYENGTTQFGAGNGVCYGPSYISPMERSVAGTYYLSPFPDIAENAYGMFAAACQFGREYEFDGGTETLISFQDEYLTNSTETYGGGDLNYTVPDFVTG
jgi:hypothetical protein